MEKALVACPNCDGEKVVKNGLDQNGKQRYRCRNPGCGRINFIGSYTNRAYDPKVREQIFVLAASGSGTRATGRILGISRDTVTAVLKNGKAREPRERDRSVGL